MSGPGFRTTFIVNPRAAGGRTGRRWGSWAPLIEAAVPGAVVWLTAGPGDGERRARRALEAGAEMVVAVGGDGTINEVVNGFFAAGRPVAPDAVLGVLAAGTGGDFVRTLRHPRAMTERIALLAGRAVRALDVGRARVTGSDGAPRERYFVNIGDFGMGGDVVARVNRSSKRLGGMLSFLTGTLASLVRFRPVPVTMRIDGGPPRTAAIRNVILANGRFFGGGMCIAPWAQTDDGLFDVVIMGALSRLRTMWVTRRLYHPGRALEGRGIETLRARRLDADSDQEVLVDLDGEQPGRLPASFELLPGALRLKVAP